MFSLVFGGTYGQEGHYPFLDPNILGFSHTFLFLLGTNLAGRMCGDANKHCYEWRNDLMSYPPEILMVPILLMQGGIVLTESFPLSNSFPHIWPIAVYIVLRRNLIEYLSRGFDRTLECKRSTHPDIHSGTFPEAKVDLPALEHLKGSSRTMTPGQLLAEVFS